MKDTKDKCFFAVVGMVIVLVIFALVRVGQISNNQVLDTTTYNSTTEKEAHGSTKYNSTTEKETHGSTKNYDATKKSYNELTNSDKKRICKKIEDLYDFYDRKEGKYSGDKYSDSIFQSVANEYGLTVQQVEIIWMNYYSY